MPSMPCILNRTVQLLEMSLKIRCQMLWKELLNHLPANLRNRQRPPWVKRQRRLQVQHRQIAHLLLRLNLRYNTKVLQMKNVIHFKATRATKINKKVKKIVYAFAVYKIYSCSLYQKSAFWNNYFKFLFSDFLKFWLCYVIKLLVAYVFHDALFQQSQPKVQQSTQSTAATTVAKATSAAVISTHLICFQRTRSSFASSNNKFCNSTFRSKACKLNRTAPAK